MEPSLEAPSHRLTRVICIDGVLQVLEESPWHSFRRRMSVLLHTWGNQTKPPHYSIKDSSVVIHNQGLGAHKAIMTLLATSGSESLELLTNHHIWLCRLVRCSIRASIRTLDSSQAHTCSRRELSLDGAWVTGCS